MSRLFWLILLINLIKFSTQNCHEKVYHSETTCSSYYYDRCQQYTTNDFHELYCYLSDGNFQFSNEIYKLYVYSSNLKHVKRSFFNNLSKLKSIAMNGDKVEDVEVSAFDSLADLQSLNLANNSIKRLNKFLSNASVRMLDLSSNNIPDIQPDALESVKNLKLLLKENKIADDTFLTTSCHELSLLDLSYNRINQLTFPDTCLKLTNLNISFNHMEEFYVNITKPKPLEVLDLSFNNLGYIYDDIFKYFSNLKELYLNQNPLFKKNNIPVNLFQNNNLLQRLYLSNTGIKILKIGTFAKLVNLAELDLSHNNLSNLPRSIFYNVNSLKILHLNNNYLTYFDYRSTNSLQKVSLDHNLWNCDILWDIVEKLTQKGVNTAYGTTNDTNHVNGISCTENILTNSSKEDNTAVLKVEYREFLSKVQRNVEEIMKKQENLYNASIISNKNSSKTFWNNLQEGHTKFFKYFQIENEKALNQTADTFRIIKTNSTTYWANFSSEQETFSKNIQSKFQTMLNQVNDAVTSIKNMPSQISGSMSETMRFKDEDSGNQKAVLVGVYGLYLVMIFVWIVSIFIVFKYRKNCQNNNITEDNALTIMHA